MIKYRAWDSKFKEYSASNCRMTTLNGITTIESDERYKLEQFTGLQDKNGVDIYVGDILTINYLNVVVYFDKTNASYRLKSTLDDYALTIDKTLRLEVTGNINENADLLKTD